MARFEVEYYQSNTSTTGVSLLAQNPTNDTQALLTAQQQMISACSEVVAISTAYDADKLHTQADTSAPTEEAPVANPGNQRRLLGRLSAWATSARNAFRTPQTAPGGRIGAGGELIVIHT